jgi:hypothetical protein
MQAFSTQSPRPENFLRPRNQSGGSLGQVFVIWTECANVSFGFDEGILGKGFWADPPTKIGVSNHGNRHDMRPS